MNIPEDLLYTKEHEWIRIEGADICRMGITDHAQAALGDITFVDLPADGSDCGQFKQFAIVESVKAASDVFAPLSGTIVGSNTELTSNPELVNQSPYDKGWFCLIKFSDEKEKEKLFSPADYRKYLEETAH